MDTQEPAQPMVRRDSELPRCAKSSTDLRQNVERIKSTQHQTKSLPVSCHHFVTSLGCTEEPILLAKMRDRKLVLGSEIFVTEIGP